MKLQISSNLLLRMFTFILYSQKKKNRRVKNCFHYQCQGGHTTQLLALKRILYIKMQLLLSEGSPKSLDIFVLIQDREINTSLNLQDFFQNTLEKRYVLLNYIGNIIFNAYFRFTVA